MRPLSVWQPATRTPDSPTALITEAAAASAAAVGAAALRETGGGIGGASEEEASSRGVPLSRAAGAPTLVSVHPSPKAPLSKVPLSKVPLSKVPLSKAPLSARRAESLLSIDGWQLAIGGSTMGCSSTWRMGGGGAS